MLYIYDLSFMNKRGREKSQMKKAEFPYLKKSGKIWLLGCLVLINIFKCFFMSISYQDVCGLVLPRSKVLQSLEKTRFFIIRLPNLDITHIFLNHVYD